MLVQRWKCVNAEGTTTLIWTILNHLEHFESFENTWNHLRTFGDRHLNCLCGNILYNIWLHMFYQSHIFTPKFMIDQKHLHKNVNTCYGGLIFVYIWGRGIVKHIWDYNWAIFSDSCKNITTNSSFTSMRILYHMWIYLWECLWQIAFTNIKTVEIFFYCV